MGSLFSFSRPFAIITSRVRQIRRSQYENIRRLCLPSHRVGHIRFGRVRIAIFWSIVFRVGHAGNAKWRNPHFGEIEVSIHIPAELRDLRTQSSCFSLRKFKFYSSKKNVKIRKCLVSSFNFWELHLFQRPILFLNLRLLSFTFITRTFFYTIILPYRNVCKKLLGHSILDTFLTKFQIHFLVYWINKFRQLNVILSRLVGGIVKSKDKNHRP